MAGRHYRVEEHCIQCACVRWFNLRYPNLRGRLFAVPNGGHRNIVTAVKLKDEGVVAGVADLILLVPSGSYGALCIEIKTPAGRQSAAQKQWERNVCAEGHYRYAVCRSLEEFVRETDAYLCQKQIKTDDFLLE